MSALSQRHDAGRRQAATRQLAAPHGPSARGTLIGEPAADTTCLVSIGGQTVGPIPIDEGTVRAPAGAEVFVYFDARGDADHARVRPTTRPSA